MFLILFIKNNFRKSKILKTLTFSTLFFIYFISFYSLQAYSQAPPVPESKVKSLDNLEKQLEQTKQKESSLKAKISSLESTLNITKKNMIKVGDAIQNNEKELQILERRVQELEQKKNTINLSLSKDRKQIAGLVLALERIRRVPPEALLARPKAPYETAQSAMLMSDIIPTLNKRAERLKANLSELTIISENLAKDKEKALHSSKSLLEEHEKLAILIKQRENIYAQTKQDYSQQQKAVLKISTQAKNLKDLVERLEKDKKRRQARLSTKKAVLSKPRTVIPDAGKARLPIAGVIQVAFNEKNTLGAESKGLEIEGRPGALVTAPMGGVIRFTGPFKRYGNLIIIEHKNGFHSLIAGLEKINTKLGRTVKAGEPIGLLQSKDNTQEKAMLYYELRKNGKPINPRKKIEGLS